ncbi:hypothetical protein HNP48_002286 [Acidovorax soli]|uniref:Uncharacterized protein n=1 Tax=Acidovorax soli TaxID=592050 RepID=A0A7X0U998_9BURK|nr:hypothetical protein [Acidovorax soli]MBB6559619.1 hypothetical protein [Acidovorax soli]
MNRPVIKYCIAALVAIAMSSSYLLDGSPSELQAAKDTAASMRDALAQHQAERPDLWTPERRSRADAAAGIIARTTRP